MFSNCYDWIVNPLNLYVLHLRAFFSSHLTNHCRLLDLKCRPGRSICELLKSRTAWVSSWTDLSTSRSAGIKSSRNWIKWKKKKKNKNVFSKIPLKKQYIHPNLLFSCSRFCSLLNWNYWIEIDICMCVCVCFNLTCIFLSLCLCVYKLIKTDTYVTYVCITVYIYV